MITVLASILYLVTLQPHLQSSFPDPSPPSGFLHAAAGFGNHGLSLLGAVGADKGHFWIGGMGGHHSGLFEDGERGHLSPLVGVRARDRDVRLQLGVGPGLMWGKTGGGVLSYGDSRGLPALVGFTGYAFASWRLNRGLQLGIGAHGTATQRESVGAIVVSLGLNSVRD